MQRRKFGKRRFHKKTYKPSLPSSIKKKYSNMSFDELNAEEVRLQDELKKITKININETVEAEDYLEKKHLELEYRDKIETKLKNSLSNKIPELTPSFLTSLLLTKESLRKKKIEVSNYLGSQLLNTIEAYYYDQNRYPFKYENKRNTDTEDLGYFLGKMRFNIENYKLHSMDDYFIENRNVLERLFNPKIHLTINEIENYKNHIKNAFLAKRKFDELKNRLPLLHRLIELIPTLRKKAKLKKDKAKLAAYEDHSRDVGKSLIYSIKNEADQNFICPYCGCNSEKEDSHVDHINPISNGGLSIKNNLVLVCSSCNLKKGNKSLWIFCKKEKLNHSEICEKLGKLGKFV